MVMISNIPVMLVCETMIVDDDIDDQIVDELENIRTDDVNKVDDNMDDSENVVRYDSEQIRVI